MKIAVYPGSFDPITLGHLDVLKDGAHMFDKVIITVSNNISKHALLSVEERKELIRQSVAEIPNVEVDSFDGLTVEYAKKVGAKVLIRGIRNASDFSYEFDLSLMNRSLNPNIETLFIPTETRFVIVKSSSIKELASFGGDISGMVPPIVLEAVMNKYPR